MIVRWIGLATVGAGVALGGWLLVPSGSLDGMAHAAPSDAVPTLAVQDPPLGALTERPLFDRTRRPLPVAEAPVPVPAAPDPVRISLSGIVGDEGEGLTALFRVSTIPGLQLVRLDDRIEGWRLEEISPAHVTLRDAEGARQRLPLK